MRVKRAVAATTLVLASFSLAGCETANIFSDNNPQLSTAPTAPAAATANISAKKSVAFAPIIGAPAGLSQQLSTTLISETQRNAVPVVQAPGSKADYTVRGYVVAAPEATGTEVSYIWDVLDAQSKRVHRITGKEIAPGPKQQDPWANVKPGTLQNIASKTATQLASFVPANAAAPQAATQPAATAPTTLTPNTQQVASQPTLQPQPAVARPTTGTTAATSAQPQPAAATVGPVAAIVPPVIGAPGDGNSTLAVALQRQLARNGVRTRASSGARTYTIKGNVEMGPPIAGKQSIRIKWDVVDPTGKKVGTVSQKNTIAQGSLNNAWGATADAAAQAAVGGVMKLLPKS